MKILIALAFSLVAFGADKTDKVEPTPAPIPRERFEQISISMIDLQSAELDEIQSTNKANAARQAYSALLESLRKEFHAEGCDLKVDKTWNCPPSKVKEGDKKK